MKCTDLAKRIEHLRPGADASEVARLCLLLSNSSCGNLDKLSDDQALAALWREIDLRVRAATDQHAAMTEELEWLGHCELEGFGPEQIQILVRAIKVQSQFLQLYVGGPPMDA